LDICRISKKDDLIAVCDLGKHALCGHFPRFKNEMVPVAGLRLGLSTNSGLLQLIDSQPIDEMYGSNYGYRSGLNKAMVAHIENKVQSLLKLRNLSAGDIVLDIGSNDGTLLNKYSDSLTRIGIDPTISKFGHFYDEGILKASEFFSDSSFLAISGGRKASIITSLSMFYDLPDPQLFCRHIANILEDDGIWHLEQSYMPSMLRTNSYDTICHEHIEYYSLSVLKYLLENSGLKVIDVSFNSINGGSFAVTAAKMDSRYWPNSSLIEWMLRTEENMNLYSPMTYRLFEHKAYTHKHDLNDLLKSLKTSGAKIAGYGASTKGNVILQFCGLDDSTIYGIADVNSDKFGCYTPGSLIPIDSESVIKAEQPDYMLVLPWHFRNAILERELEYLQKGGKLIFPLPEIEIVG